MMSFLQKLISVRTPSNGGTEISFSAATHPNKRIPCIVNDLRHLTHTYSHYSFFQRMLDIPHFFSYSKGTFSRKAFKTIIYKPLHSGVDVILKAHSAERHLRRYFLPTLSPFGPILRAHSAERLEPLSCRKKGKVAHQSKKIPRAGRTCNRGMLLWRGRDR